MKKTLAAVRLFAAAIIVSAIGIYFEPVIAQSIGVIIRAQDGTSQGPSISGSTDITSGLSFGTGYTSINKHLATGGSNTPTLSTCGTSPTLATGSTDTAGKITVGTSASNACTLTFAVAYTTAPFCIVQNLTTGAAANVYTVIGATIIWSSALADSTVLVYHCIAPAGG